MPQFFIGHTEIAVTREQRSESTQEQDNNEDQHKDFFDGHCSASFLSYRDAFGTFYSAADQSVTAIELV